MQQLAEGGDHFRGIGAQDKIDLVGFGGRRVTASANEQNRRARIAAAQKRNDGAAIGAAERVAEDGDVPAPGRDVDKGLGETGKVHDLEPGAGKHAGAGLHQQQIISNLQGLEHRGRNMAPELPNRA